MIVSIAGADLAQSLGQVDVGPIGARGQIAVGEDVGHQAGFRREFCQVIGKSTECCFRFAGAVVGDQACQSFFSKLCHVPGTVQMVNAGQCQPGCVSNVMEPRCLDEDGAVLWVGDQCPAKRGGTKNDRPGVGRPALISFEQAYRVLFGPAMALHLHERRGRVPTESTGRSRDLKSMTRPAGIPGSVKAAPGTPGRQSLFGRHPYRQ